MKRKSYLTGSKVFSYKDDPSTELAQNQINLAKAKYEAETNPFLLGMSALGEITQQLGKSKMSEEMEETGEPNKLSEQVNFLTSVLSFANGGVAPGVPIEVEGDEIIQQPGGAPIEMKGPSHEQGGIDIDVAEGTEIFSQRLRGRDGKTMAERKKIREKNISKYQKLLEKNPQDNTLRRTLEKIAQDNEKQEQEDLVTMEVARNIVQGKNKFGLGGYTTGDYASLAGTLIGGFGPYFNTLKNRSEDTPNVNAFKSYGQRALDTIQDGKEALVQQEKGALLDLDRGRATSIRQNRNSSRGINTQRAMNLATDMQTNIAKGDLQSKYAEILQGIFAQEAQFMNQQDTQVMTGEQAKDLANREDKDNYFSQLSSDIANIGTSLQQTGKNLNTKETDAMMEEIMKNLYTNYTYKDGKVQQSGVGKTAAPSAVKGSKIGTSKVVGEATKIGALDPNETLVKSIKDFYKILELEKNKK